MSSFIAPTKSALQAPIKKRSAGQFEGTICCGEEEQEEYYESEDEEEEEDQEEGTDNSLNQELIETVITPTIPASTSQTQTKTKTLAKTNNTAPTTTTNTINQAITEAFDEISKATTKSITYKYQKAANKAKNVDVITDQLTTGRLPSDLSAVHSINSQQVSVNESFADVYKKLAADEKVILRDTCNAILKLRQAAHQHAVDSLLSDVEQRADRDKIINNLRNRASKIDPDANVEDAIMQTANTILQASGEARTNFNIVRARNVKEFATKQRLYDLRIARQAEYMAQQPAQPAPRKPTQITSYYQRTDGDNTQAYKNPRRDTNDTNHHQKETQERPNNHTKVRAPNEQPNDTPHTKALIQQPHLAPNHTSPAQNNTHQAPQMFPVQPTNQMMQGAYNPFVPVPGAGFQPNSGFWMPNPNFQYQGTGNPFNAFQQYANPEQHRTNTNPTTPNRKNNKG